MYHCCARSRIFCTAWRGVLFLIQIRERCAALCREVAGIWRGGVLRRVYI
jgi:hypothetical protein